MLLSVLCCLGVRLGFDREIGELTFVCTMCIVTGKTSEVAGVEWFVDIERKLLAGFSCKVDNGRILLQLSWML